MKINNKIANGIVVSTDDFEYAMAVRKPNPNTTIIREFWFKGKPIDLKRIILNSRGNKALTRDFKESGIDIPDNKK